MRSRTEAAALHGVLRQALTLSEDYERALLHLLAHAPADDPGAHDELPLTDYLRFRTNSLGAVLSYVQSYLQAVRNCVATASGQGLHFNYVAESGGLTNAKFYDYAVSERGFLEREPAVYALIVAYQELYAQLSQKISGLKAAA